MVVIEQIYIHNLCTKTPYAVYHDHPKLSPAGLVYVINICTCYVIEVHVL